MKIYFISAKTIPINNVANGEVILPSILAGFCSISGSLKPARTNIIATTVAVSDGVFSDYDVFYII